MRCPYCGGLNKEEASFCSSCGRDLIPPAQAQQSQRTQQPSYPQRPLTPPSHAYPQQPQRPPYPPAQRPASPYPNPPRPPVTPQPMRAPGNNPPPAPPVMPGRPASTSTIVPPSVLPQSPRPPVAPEPPAPFPPRTVEQLQALEPGALTYTVVEENLGNGRKKTVRITYPRAVAWQQVATLLKAFKEQQSEAFESIIIQGVQAGETNPYRFTNGQLCFDRRVRLGDRLLNRYQIETGSGFESDALRIVLSEES